RGEASAHDRLQLGRAYTDEAPAKAAPLLEEAAAALDGDDQQAAHYEAAEAWRAAGEAARAAVQLEAALAAGLDDVAAHVLGLELLEGESRRRSIERVVELEADASWPEERRASL